MAYRLERTLTHDHMAELVGVRLRTINSYENDAAPTPRQETVRQLA